MMSFYRNMLPVAITAVLCVTTLVILNANTRETIRANSQKYFFKVFETMVPVDYNNSIYIDYVEIKDPASPDVRNAARVYRVRKDNMNMGVIYMPVTAAGYNGPIKLAISISKPGRIMAIKVIEQNESDGLGDQIDNDKTDWVDQFNTHSLLNTPVQKWQIKEDAGVFDAVSGATITSRAVTFAIRLTLEHYQLNSDILYRQESTSDH